MTAARGIVPKGLVDFFKDSRDYREIQRFFQNLAAQSAPSSDATTLEEVQGQISNLRARMGDIQAQTEAIRDEGMNGFRARLADIQSQLDELHAEGVGGLRARTGMNSKRIDDRLPISSATPRTAWDDILNTGLGGSITVGTGVPSLVQVNGGAYALDFDDAATATEKRILYDPQMTHGIKKGSAFFPHLHFLPQSIPVSTQVSKWEIAWITFDNMGDASIAGRLTTSTVYVPVYTTDTANGYTIRGFYTSSATFDSSTRFSIANANSTASSIYSMTIRRKSGDAGDTYAGASIYLLSFDGHIEIDRRGTLTEFA